MNYRKIIVVQTHEMIVGPTETDEQARALVEQTIRDGELPEAAYVEIESVEAI